MPDRGYDRQAVIVLAHGIGGVRDLPVPASSSSSAAAIVLVVSFVLLLRALAAAAARGARGRAGAARLAQPRPALARAARAARARSPCGLLVLTLARRSSGRRRAPELRADVRLRRLLARDPAPVGRSSATSGGVLSPWRAIADATVWLIERGGREARPVLEWPERLGAVSRRAALFAFVALELAHPRPAYPRTLAIAIALYSYWALAGMAVYGRDAVDARRRGLRRRVRAALRGSRRSPRATAASSSAGRSPGSRAPTACRGTLVFVAVMLGSTSFDGFSRTTHLAEPARRTCAQPRRLVAAQVDLATTFVNLGGLLALRGAVVLAYLPCGRRRRREARSASHRSLVPDFVLPLVPIAFAYIGGPLLLAVRSSRGSSSSRSLSDPFGRGWDLFGTVDFAPNLAIVSHETVWYVQVGALVVGHVAGLAIAHDRAVALFERPATRAPLPVPDARR